MTARRPALPDHPAGLVALGILLLGLELALALTGTAPPRPLPASAPAASFSAERAIATLGRLLDRLGPHPVASPAVRVMQERIVAELRALGLEPEVQETWSCSPGFSACAPVANVVATVPGREELDAIVVLAHYDSVHAGPGAADDGSGVATALEAARALLAGEPPLRPVRIVLLDGEEAGLLGAEAFFRRHPLAGQTFAVVNLEARGTTGPSLMFETSAGDRPLAAAFARAVPRPVASSLFVEVYRRLPNDTDLTVALAAGHAGLNLAFSDGVARYHTPADDLAHLDPGSVQHQGDAALAVVRELGDATSRAVGDAAAFTDLFGRTLLHWPAAWSLPLALAALLCTAAAGLSARGSLRAGLIDLLLGLGAWLGALVAGGALAIAGSALVIAVTGDSAPWRAHPGPLRTAVWAAVFLGALAVSSLARRRLGTWSLVAGSWCGWSLAAALLAASMPGAAAALLAPVLAAAVVLAAARIVGRRRPGLGAAAAAIGGALAGGLTGFSLARLGEIGLGLGTAGTALVAVTLGLVATSAAPLVSSSVLRRPVLGALAGVAAAAWVAAIVVPPADADSPRRLNLIHLQQGAPDGPQWVARTGWGRAASLPAALAAEAPFTRALAPPLPWWGGQAPLWLAPAPAAVLDPPRIEIRSSHPTPDGGRAVRATLVAGSLPNLVLALPESSSPRGLLVEGLDAGAGRRAGGYLRFELDGVPPEGLEVVLELAGAAPARALLVAWGPGLPEAGARLAAARPPEVVPWGAGDITAVVARSRL